MARKKIGKLGNITYKRAKGMAGRPITASPIFKHPTRRKSGGRKRTSHK